VRHPTKAPVRRHTRNLDLPAADLRSFHELVVLDRRVENPVDIIDGVSQEQSRAWCSPPGARCEERMESGFLPVFRNVLGNHAPRSRVKSGHKPVSRIRAPLEGKGTRHVEMNGSFLPGLFVGAKTGSREGTLIVTGPTPANHEAGIRQNVRVGIESLGLIPPLLVSEREEAFCYVAHRGIRPAQSPIKLRKKVAVTPGSEEARAEEDNTVGPVHAELKDLLSAREEGADSAIGPWDGRRAVGPKHEPIGRQESNRNRQEVPSRAAKRGPP